MEAVRVRDVMQPLSEFIDASQSVAVARQRMQGVEAIRSLLVVDESRRLVGAVRYADLSQADASVTVGEVATVDPPTAQVDQPLQELVGLMTESGLDRLPVVDAEGIVIGELPRAMLTTAEHTATTGARTQSDSYSPLGAPSVAVEKDMGVVGASGDKIGTVKEVLVDALNDELTHIVVHTGWLFGKDHAVPADLIDGVAEGKVMLKVDKSEVSVLPDLHGAP
jgi:CBS domain-containing protein/sporulation protein YlmC with PRC-barrel domain